MKTEKYDEILNFIRSLYPNETPVPLHAPRFVGNEKKYLAECIDTTFVSYVGKFVTDFEEHAKRITGAKYAIAMVNGTAALQMALLSAGVQPGDEVITQALTFVATAAAIKHAGAEPSFVDVDVETLGMSPDSLRSYLAANAEIRSGKLFNKKTGRHISAVVPMHTFGHPVRIDEILLICQEYNLMLIEDSAESIGSYFKEKHTGTFGRAGILSFNGNKPITTGGGGMFLTNDEDLATRARYISTTAKRKHRWEFFHEEVGYNLRLPNVNAAIGCAQMEYFPKTIENKRQTAALYKDFFASIGVRFFSEPKNCTSNYWLNAIILDDRSDREAFLEYANDNNVQTRPIWTLMSKLPPYADCFHDDLKNSEWLEDRIINIPSSVRL
jgi:Predicted pyridoxal phosphate-dependent enzyme apparently involved in regulation of cell wall biogenesis